MQQPATAKHTKMATRLSTGAAPVPYQSAMGYESERGAHECEGFGQGSLSLEPQGVFGSQFRSQAVWEGAERERERNDDEWDSGKEHSQNSQNGSWPRGYLLSRSSSCASENNNGEDPKMWGLDVFENDNSVLDDFSRRLQVRVQGMCVWACLFQQEGKELSAGVLRVAAQLATVYLTFILTIITHCSSHLLHTPRAQSHTRQLSRKLRTTTKKAWCWQPVQLRQGTGEHLSFLICFSDLCFISIVSLCLPGVLLSA